jgi:hypothetical protein
MDCAGVLTGGFSSAELKEAGCVHVFRDACELSRALV